MGVQEFAERVEDGTESSGTRQDICEKSVYMTGILSLYGESIVFCWAFLE